MAKQKSEKAVLALTAGEISPLLDGRTDVDKIEKSARILENMLIETTGRVQARTGTQFIALAKESEPP